MWKREVECSQMMKRFLLNTSILVQLVCLPMVYALNFTYSNSGTNITITGYIGSGGAETIPSTIEGLPVTGIQTSAFEGNEKLSSLSIPSTIISIGNS